MPNQERRDFFLDTVAVLRKTPGHSHANALGDVLARVADTVDRIFVQAKMKGRLPGGSVERTLDLIRLSLLDALVHGQFRNSGGDPERAAGLLSAGGRDLEAAYSETMATVKARFAEYGNRYRRGLLRLHELLKQHGGLRYGVAEYCRFHEVIGTTIEPYGPSISMPNGFFSPQGLEIFDPHSKELIPERLTDRMEHARDIHRYALAMERLPEEFYVRLRAVYDKNVPAKRIGTEIRKSGMLPPLLIAQVPLLETAVRSMILAELLSRHAAEPPAFLLPSDADLSRAAGLLRDEFYRCGGNAADERPEALARILGEAAGSACERFLATFPQRDDISDEREELGFDDWLAREFRMQALALLDYALQPKHADILAPDEAAAPFSALTGYVQTRESLAKLWKIDFDKALREMEMTMRDDFPEDI